MNPFFLWHSHSWLCSWVSLHFSSPNILHFKPEAE
jgi:hypothetical protein